MLAGVVTPPQVQQPRRPQTRPISTRSPSRPLLPVCTISVSLRTLLLTGFDSQIACCSASRTSLGPLPAWKGNVATRALSHFSVPILTNFFTQLTSLHRTSPTDPLQKPNVVRWPLVQSVLLRSSLLLDSTRSKSSISPLCLPYCLYICARLRYGCLSLVFKPEATSGRGPGEAEAWRRSTSTHTLQITFIQVTSCHSVFDGLQPLQ